MAAASDIPYVIALVRGRLPQWIASLHSQYDSTIVRISPTELSFINADAWEDIYSKRSSNDSFERDERVYGKPPNGVHSLLTAPKADHARMRRVLEHAFSDRAYREQIPLVSAHIDKLMGKLHEQLRGSDGGVVNLLNWYNWTSFDIVGDLTFGKSFDCLQKEENHPWVKMIFENLKGITLLSACNRFMLLRHLLPYVIPKHVIQAIKDHWESTTESVERRMELGTDRTDFMSPILKHMDDTKTGLKHEELMSNASLFIIAGSESIATVLSGTTYWLLQNPEVKKTLTEEIDRSFTKEDEINAESVSQLPYLNACLSETNRIYPTALTGQAMRAPPGGSEICGRWIPGGVRISFLPCAFQPSYLFTSTHTDCIMIDRCFYQPICSLPLAYKLQRSQHLCPRAMAEQRQLCLGQ